LRPLRTQHQNVSGIGTHTTEGTGKTDPAYAEKVQLSPNFRSKSMTTITYRGQQYDKEAYKAAVLEEQTQKQNHNLMYRGIRIERKFASKS